MLILGILSFLVCLVTSFLIVVDMFKKNTAIGCLGLIFLPIMPFIWIFKGYSGNKKKAGIILFASAIIAFGLIGFEWYTAKSELKPFIEQSSVDGINFSLKSISSSGSGKTYTLISDGVYEPQEEYNSVDKMLEIIYKEKISNLTKYFPSELSEGTVIAIAIPTKSGFVAVYEISGPNQLKKSYVSSYDDL